MTKGFIMKRAIIGLAVWLLVSMSAGLIGSRYAPGEWYASLTKPSWTPPSYLFGPVWTALYLMMGVAAWLVWRQHGFTGAALPLGLFIVQLALNAAWSPLFFGLHRPDIALIDIIALWAAILLTLIAFWRHNAVAGILMFPYLGWVTYAAALNHQLWWLNR
jgi:tryptophan-rich sensory protein